MAKDIEIQVMNSDGTYEVLYSASRSHICYNSDVLRQMWNLAENSTLDDAFEQLQRQLILIQYNKAGVTITAKSPSGVPMPGIKIMNLYENYDESGNNFCITGEDGTCFGYCNGGNTTLSFPNYLDCDVNNNEDIVFNAGSGLMYNFDVEVGNFTNFWKFVASTSAINFSSNCERVDVTCVGGGGSGGEGYNPSSGADRMGMGGGGGYCTVQENVPFIANTDYQVNVGSGGASSSNNGGQSIFLNVTANGGQGGKSLKRNDEEAWVRAQGNGLGGVYNDDAKPEDRNGTEGTVAGYSSFTETVIYGGGGGAAVGDRAGYGGNGGNSSLSSGRTTYGYPGEDGFGGGGGGGDTESGRDHDGEEWRGGKGGNGCVAVRMHLKVTS